MLVATNRTLINRKKLLAMIPLAERTIFNMELRGEFPRRIALTSRNVAWDLAEIEEWIQARKSSGIQAARPGMGGLSRGDRCGRVRSRTACFGFHMANFLDLSGDAYRTRIKAAARPGESWEQVTAQLRIEDKQQERASREERASGELIASLNRLGENIRRNNGRAGTEVQAEARLREKFLDRCWADDLVQPAPKSHLRKPPADDMRSDFFVPALCDVGTRDNRSMMDVAIFRLSKRRSEPARPSATSYATVT